MQAQRLVFRFKRERVNHKSRLPHGRGKLPTWVVMMRSILLHPRTLLRNPLLPEITGRELGAVGEHREFCPCDLWMDSSTEPAVGAGNHIFAADNLCETRDPIRDETRMLDHVRRMTDHSGNENLVLRQFYFLPHTPFVLMADIAASTE